MKYVIFVLLIVAFVSLPFLIGTERKPEDPTVEYRNLYVIRYGDQINDTVPDLVLVRSDRIEYHKGDAIIHIADDHYLLDTLTVIYKIKF